MTELERLTGLDALARDLRHQVDEALEALDAMTPIDPVGEHASGGRAGWFFRCAYCGADAPREGDPDHEEGCAWAAAVAILRHNGRRLDSPAPIRHDPSP